MTDLERGPSSDGESAICASSLNKPSSQEGLKPCPFCGNAPLSISNYTDKKPTWAIFCHVGEKCLATVSVCERTEAEATVAWNTRTPTNESPAPQGRARWRYEIQHGPDGEADYAWVYDDKNDMVCTAKTHQAVAIVSSLNAISASAVLDSSDLHYLGAIKLRLERLYEENPQDAHLREHISDEVSWIDGLTDQLATPAPQPPVEGLREALRAKINEVNILVREYDTSNPDWAFRSGVMLNVLTKMCRDLDALASPSLTAGENTKSDGRVQALCRTGESEPSVTQAYRPSDPSPSDGAAEGRRVWGTRAPDPEAATIISDLQAELERDKLFWNGRCVDLQVNAHGWMKAHDQLLGFIQSKPELLKSLIDEKLAIKYPSPADVPEILQRALAAESSLAEMQAERDRIKAFLSEGSWATIESEQAWKRRALAAESSLHRVRGETIEECASIANEHAARLQTPVQDGNRVKFNHEARRVSSEQCSIVAASIRSLNKTGLDSEKTAESEHSPSTLNAETE